MRICVISDIHSEIIKLDAVMKNVGNVDGIIFLGDLFDRGVDSHVTYKLFKKWFEEKNHNSQWICGNHDRAILYSLLPDAHPDLINYFTTIADDYRDTCKLRAMGIPVGHAEMVANRPVYGEATLGGLRVYMTHGFPHNDDIKKATQYDYQCHPNNGTSPTEVAGLINNAHILLVGHSHCQTAWLYTAGEQAGWTQWIPDFGTALDGTIGGIVVGEFGATLDFSDLPEGSFLILNPGSVGSPRDPRASMNEANRAFTQYLVLEIDDMRISAKYKTMQLKEG
ncbi:predicted phosphoesterase [Longilinea arvoryzae]|uniref:Predicted phosphoesterase n=1 Tax=Longilinea arvoryzae TaxID=360412 RepID=A0A0S7BD23_9CHLR|nr:metallophosphoesterase family protein [Longilinea arvoryzae]GAP13177.1 predicted phosphoesterase [Longilinea arvoryzae]